MLRERRRHAHYKLNGRLDRKSSRGMIYENEELRLRTININAEVERGQSDIRKLRRENEQLRREIWSLRDEYDRLNKRFKANKYQPDSISEHGQSDSNTEDSDSCDTCRGDVEITEECLVEQHDSGRHRESFPPLPARQQYDRYPLEGSICKGEPSNELCSSTSATSEAADNSAAAKSRDHLHVNFDHLSIVSEENLSNSDGNLTQPCEANHHHHHHQQQQQPHLQQQHHNYYYDENFIEIDGSRLSPSQCIGAMSLPSLVGPLTPMTPIELVANQLNDLQSIVPPLSYFENVVQQQHMGTNINSIVDSNASTNTGETVIQTNGWDYNIQSPFVHRKFHSSEPSSSNSTSTTMSPSHLGNPAPAREGTPQTDVSTNASVSNPDGAYKNPKHFFSPIKPRLKLDTALAAKAASITVPPAVQYLEHLHQNCDPPDVYITNAMGSPYYPQPIAGLSLPSVLVPPVQQSYIEPIYATAQKKPQCFEQSRPTTGSSKNSVNLEQILNEIGTISEDILQLQLDKNRSQEKLITDNNYLTTSSTSATNTPQHTATTHTQTLSSTSSPTHSQKEQQQASMPSDKNHKPYRSEMNLLLSYNGSNPVIIPLAKNPTAVGDMSTSEAAQVLVVDEGGTTADRDGNSPSPPQLPTPMAPFPTNLMYLGFDRLNQSLGDSIGAKAALQYINSPSLDATDQYVNKSPPPQPPTSPLPPTCFPNSGTSVFHMRDQDSLHPGLAISSPDLSTSPICGTNLAAIAPLKRRIFSRQNDNGSSSQITRSFDGGEVDTIRYQDAKEQVSLPDAVKSKILLDGSANEISSYESSSGSEATKRKSSRRVSIICRDEKPDKNVEPSEGQLFEQLRQSSASVDKLDDMMPSLVGNLKHAHSTPNSPHSNRRRGGHTNSALSVNSGSSTLHHHGHHHHHHSHHHHSRKMSQESVAEGRGTSMANSIVNSSQDNVLGAGATTSSHQHSTRYKCSRRHSEGTVSSLVGGDRAAGGGSVGGAGIRLSGTGNHHHHHHHQDSNQETGTSISERNSGSLASSRDSSTSLSMRSQRRKISISSHTGGKIPWCGCWGNGCL